MFTRAHDRYRRFRDKCDDIMTTESSKLSKKPLSDFPLVLYPKN